MATRKWLGLLVVPAFLAMACSGNTTTPVTPTPPTPNPPPPPSVTAYLAGAGDIADCASVGADRGAHGEAPAKLLDKTPEAMVFTHDHVYERFNPQDPNGLPGPPGISEYIVGTGGAPLYDFGPTALNSAYKTNRSYGVLRLTLRDVGYDSVFVEAGTEATLDPSFGNLCH